MNVFKLKSLYQLLNMIFYFIIIGTFTSLFVIYVDYIRAIVFALISIILSLCILFTWRVYIKSDEVYMGSLFLYKISKLHFKWEDITNAKYKNWAVYLYNAHGKKIKLSKIYKNYEQMWMQIYEEINRNNNDCTIDESFIKIINSLKNEDERLS